MGTSEIKGEDLYSIYVEICGLGSKFLQRLHSFRAQQTWQQFAAREHCKILSLLFTAGVPGVMPHQT
ncbi:hypothetical protein OIU74_017497 [Salix koriyanagi]|uniref:Uncharacterized protein n=1 Tax=Salix koriyanagi TaxID=2511006 RepID=A0A9Q0WPV9_9ROSI|nr:hypothetical protein OIU74_017497 [Salix koriyanagi]